MNYELPEKAKIQWLDSYYKSDSFLNESGSLFKSFFTEFCKQAFAVNLKAQEGLGYFPIAFEEKDARASISYALHSLTPYVLSENSIKYKKKIKGEAQKEDKSGRVDFWCAEKDFKFEAYIESKKIWLNINEESNKRELANKSDIKKAFDQITRLKSAGVDKEGVKYTSGVVFKVALFQIPIVYHPRFKPEKADLESAPKCLEGLLVDKIKEFKNAGLLLSALDMRPFGDWEGEKECNPFNTLAAVVMQ